MLLDNHFGPDQRVLREAELLATAGLDLTIVAWDRRAVPHHISIELPPSVHVIRVHEPAPPGGGLRTVPPLVRFVVRVVRHHLDVLRDAALFIAHDLYLLPFGVLLRRWLKKPLVYDAHEDFALMEGDGYPNWLLTLINRAETFLARRAAIIVVPGRVRQPRWTDASLPLPVVLSNIGAMSNGIGAHSEIEWDIVYCGIVVDSRRPDLLIELARSRPDLRIAIAGNGRAVPEIEETAKALPNLSFLGWVDDPEKLLLRSRAVYYGLDPENTYASSACPNNLYQAIRVRRPLIFFCSGEPGEMAARFQIGMRIRPEVGELAQAVDAVTRAEINWEFAQAWAAVEAADTGQQYADAIRAAAQRDGCV